MKKKRHAEPAYCTSSINNKVINYKVFNLSFTQKILYAVPIFVIGGVVGLVFYANLFMKDGIPTTATHISNLFFFCGVGFGAIKMFFPILIDSKKKKRQEMLRKQFREMLASLSSSFSAGVNVVKAIGAAKNDMISQFGENSYIAVEMREIEAQMDNGISVYDALKEFSKRSGVEDIEDFANVFEICYLKGGNMQKVVRNTYDLIGDKIAINEEIETKLTSNKMQQKIMSVVPIVMIGFLRMTSSSFAENFATPKGVLSITIAVAMFIGAYVYGNKIVNIKG